MKLTRLVGFVVITVVLIYSCQLNTIEGSGNVVSEKRIVEQNFVNIEAGNGLDIEVEQAEEAAVVVMADDNLQKHIKTEISNRTHKISSDFNSYRNVKMKKVFIKMPTIEKIKISSGARFTTKSDIICKAIDIQARSGSFINAALEAEKTTCETSSGGTIQIMGKSLELECASSSGSRIDAKKLMANNIIASASSGSSMEVFPLVTINADASSGGSINYHNDPKNVNKKSTSGGSVTRQ